MDKRRSNELSFPIETFSISDMEEFPLDKSVTSKASFKMKLKTE